MTSDRADRNQSTLMITITIPGASVQEAIDLEREVLREEGRRGPAVRWVLVVAIFLCFAVYSDFKRNERGSLLKSSQTLR